MSGVFDRFGFESVLAGSGVQVLQLDFVEENFRKLVGFGLVGVF